MGFGVDMPLQDGGITASRFLALKGSLAQVQITDQLDR